ncbi:hypothetical protein D3Z36_07160 [Lachnospiraceae bacterium]|nr:hypothetical protein [Lachnospiraceae bacterium]
MRGKQFSSTAKIKCPAHWRRTIVLDARQRDVAAAAIGGSTADEQSGKSMCRRLIIHWPGFAAFFMTEWTVENVWGAYAGFRMKKNI